MHRPGRTSYHGGRWWQTEVVRQRLTRPSPGLSSHTRPTRRVQIQGRAVCCCLLTAAGRHTHSTSDPGVDGTEPWQLSLPCMYVCGLLTNAPTKTKPGAETGERAETVASPALPLPLPANSLCRK